MNDFVDTPIGVQNKDLDNDLNATNNWWDSDAGPTHESNTYNVGDQGAAVSDNVDFTPWLDGPVDEGQSFAPVVNVDTGDEYPAIQAAIKSAKDDDSLHVNSGAYEENVEIGKNISLIGDGAGDTTIAPPSGHAISTTAHTVGQLDGVTVRGFTLDGGDNGFGFIALSGTATDSPDTKNLTIENVRTNGDLFVLSSVEKAKLERISVKNTSTTNGVGAVELTGVSDLSITDSQFVNNTRAIRIQSTDGLPQTAYGENGFISVKNSSFEDNEMSIVNGDEDSVVDASLNWWDGDDGPDVSAIDGVVSYAPYLTELPEDLESDRVWKTTSYAHEITLKADGELRSVAFPAPVSGTVEEVFPRDVNGTIYAYDGDSWQTGNEIADKDIDALDAFIIAIDSDSKDMQLRFEYESDDSIAPTMTSTGLEAGWNFVGAPQQDSSADAFASSTADVSKVFNPADRELSYLPYGLYGTHEPVNPEVVSPYQGYWVFANDDGTLGATLPADPSYDIEYPSLNQTAAK